MRRYYIKCEAGKVEYVDILSETGEGYQIRVTRIQDGYEKNIDDFMTKQLFNLCLKTGYIRKEEFSISSVA
ncbi:MAG: hypothetical protein LBT16_05105 [Treponema sp.]|jgi:hypothetical protein|nr:hypothetical protein [Treponema sp.]